MSKGSHFKVFVSCFKFCIVYKTTSADFMYKFKTKKQKPRNEEHSKEADSPKLASEIFQNRFPAFVT